MSHETYAIIFAAEIAEGFTAETVKAQLENYYKWMWMWMWMWIELQRYFPASKLSLKKVIDRAAAKK